MNAAELSPSNRDFLLKVCGMLGSDHGGERAAAALKASNFLRRNELSWSEVIRAASAGDDGPKTAGPAAKPRGRQTGGWTDWRADLAMCRNCRLSLTRRESDLVERMSGARCRPTAAEVAEMAQIAVRLRSELRRAA